MKTFQYDKNNELRSVSVAYTPHFDNKNKLIAFVGTVFDITERVRAEADAAGNRKTTSSILKMDTIGMLAGGIAHDFNNRLGVITGNVSYLLHELKHDADLTEVLLNVQESAKQAADLTRQLITFARAGRRSKNRRISIP